MRSPAPRPPRVGFVSLGCPKALVDSERILTRLRAEGYEIAPSYTDADLVVVNTCGFIDEARAESLEAIGEAVEENGRVIVTGCLGVHAREIRSACPQVLEVTGPHACEQVMEAVHAHLPPPEDAFGALVPPGAVRLTPGHYAYLKISEGCNHRCSFCIIPSLRGDLHSRPLGEVMDEAQRLAESGVREILVIAQDTSAYGVDLRYRTGFWRGRPIRTRFQELAGALGELGVWIRLHYVYPYPHVDDVVPLMAEGRILPYLDVPLQHASPRILRLMRRPAASADTLARIRTWREICPDITLRSTFIVGFPGETEADFQELLSFLERARLDRVGCFRYSPVAGARANALPDAVPEELKEERYERLMAVQERISRERLQGRVGAVVEVLIDEAAHGQAIGRSRGDAPEIDGRVHIRGVPGTLQAGDLVPVRVEAADEHDLFGHLAG